MVTLSVQLTHRQAEVLATIRQFIESNGYPPTIREIGLRLGIASPNGVVCHLSQLEAKGAISRDPLVARGIRFLKDFTSLPEAENDRFKVFARDDFEACA